MCILWTLLCFGLFEWEPPSKNKKTIFCAHRVEGEERNICFYFDAFGPHYRYCFKYVNLVITVHYDTVYIGLIYRTYAVFVDPGMKMFAENSKKGQAIVVDATPVDGS